VKTLPRTFGIACFFIGIYLSVATPSRGESIRERLNRHMASMPSDSATRRRAFTRADTLTREYIVSQFAACGLKPISDRGDYLQRFSILRRIMLVPTSSVVVSSNDSSWVLKRKDEYVVHEESGDGVFSGGVAFIGYGIRAPQNGYDDFSKVDLRGKTVICYSSPPTHIDMKLRMMSWQLPYKAKIALIDSLGGRAAVFVDPASYRRTCNTLHDIDESSKGPDISLWKQATIPVLRITHDALTRLMDRAGIDIASVERDLETASSSRAFVVPAVEVSMNVELERSYGEASNILGLLEGRDTTRTIVIGAHYDGPGYNDNASGVSEMLEIARLCSERSALDCNLLFAAFGLEERGLVGSKYFINNIPARVGALKAMVNFDVIGRIDGDTLIVGNVQPEGEWERIASTLDNRGLVVESKPWVGGTDSQLFTRGNVPVFWFFEGFHGNPHLRDSLSSMNLDGMERALHYAFNMICRISDDNVKLGSPVHEKPINSMRRAGIPDLPARPDSLRR
jgi:hypothetical protein